MLTIRTEQITAFERAVDERYIEDLTDYLLQTHPKAPIRSYVRSALLSSLTRTVVLRLVRNGIARARSHGLTWKGNIAAFVTLMVIVSPNFDQDPVVARILREARESIDRHWESIWDDTTNDDWARIRDSYDTAAWTQGVSVA
jgi:hypothetical protein